MKVTHAFAASVIAGGLLLTGTACSNNEPAQEPSPSVSATVAPTQDIGLGKSDETLGSPGTTAPAQTDSPASSSSPDAPIATSEDSVAVMETINSYYAFVLTPEATAALEKMSKNFTGEDPTPDQLQAAVASAPEVFTYYDSSSSENIKNAIQEFAMSAGMTAMSQDKITFTAPAEAVTVDGDTAKLDVGAVIITVNGETIDTGETAATGEDNLNFIKKDGKWLMVAKGFTMPDSSPAPQ